MQKDRMSYERADWSDTGEEEIYPLAAAATCLLVGLAVGVVGTLLFTTPARPANLAERVGEQILKGVRSITPQSWS